MTTSNYATISVGVVPVIQGAETGAPETKVRRATQLSEDISLDDIALLSDIGSFNPVSERHHARLQNLVGKGLVTSSDGSEHVVKYALTAKAESLLTSRGAGLNEA